MRVILFFLLTAILMFGCVVDQGKVAIDIKRKNLAPASNPSTLASANISNIQVINNQLVITGSGLSGVTNVKVDGNSLNQNFAIETKSATQIIANAVSAFSFDVSKVFNLILSDAYGAATFPIDFSLCNATLNGKGFDCAAPVTDKDVLSYDQPSGKWIPRAVNGLSYRGTWDANNAQPGGALAGDYYIVSVSNPPTYGVGDWIVWNGGSFEKINNTTTITSVFGRTGAVVATKGDYDLNKLTDVDLTIPAAVGKVLKFDGMKWIAGDDLSGGGAGSITATEIAANAVTDAKIDSVSASKITGTLTSAQIADGTIVNADINAAAAIDYSKLNIPNTTIPYAKLNIADGDIPAAKISGLPSATVVLATTITDADTTHAPDGNAVYDALALKLGLSGGVLNIGATISGLPALPTVGSEAASKDYVDTKIPKSAIPTCGANEVLKSNGTAFSCVTDSNGTFNSTAGRAIATDGSGNLVVSTTTATELGYVNGVTSSIQTQLNAKQGTITAGTTAQYYRGDKTFVTLDSSVVPENTNLYFTEPRVRTSVLTGLNTGVAGPITATDDVLGAFGKLQYQVTDLKSNGQWIKTGNDIAYSAGNVQVDKKFLLKDGGSNFVEIKAPATVTSTYTLTLPANDGNVDQVLRTDGAGVLSWVDASDASIQAFAKMALPTCAAGEVLKSNGTAFSCVPDVSGAGAFTGTINKAVATDGSGALISSTTSATELGYVAGVTSAIQTQLDAKQGTITAGTAAQYYRGDKTFVTLDTAVVPENGNLYFTTARAKGATVADAIADTVVDVAPSQNAVFDALALKLSLAGGVLNIGATISGLPAVPTVGSEATSKDYVDTKIPKSAIPTCGAGEVLKSNGTAFSCVTDSTGEAAITAGTTAQYYRGDKTFVTLDSSVVPENTNLYFTEPRVRATVLTGLNTGVAGPITATDDVLGAFGKMQYQVTDLKAKGQWEKTGSDVYYSAGDVRIDNNLKLKDSGTNYVLIKAPATVTSTYTLTMPPTAGTANYVLQTNGAGGVLSWVPLTDASVQAFAKSALPTCGANEVLKSNGTAFSCVTDTNGTFNSTAGRAIATDGSGNLVVSTTTATELGYVNGVTSSIQTQLDAKQGNITAGTTAQYYRGDKTFATLDTSAVPENTNLYFTEPRVRGTVLTGLSSTAGNIAATDTVLGAFGKLLNTQTDSVSKTGNSTITGTLTINTIVGALTVPNPVAPNDAVNKSYVDGLGQWIKGTGGNAADIYRASGNVGVGTSTPGATLDVNGTIRANQICDSVGANCKTISAGWGNIAAASIVSNWPDAILCNTGTDSSILFHDTHESGTNLEYYSKASGGAVHYLRFNGTTGAAYDNSGFTGNTACSAKSIATLVTEGRTFGLLGGGVDWTVSGANIYRAGGNVGIGTSAPAGLIHLNGANQNAASSPLFKMTDTALSGSYFAIDNGASASGYRIISAGASTKNIEIQSGTNSNQLFLNSAGNVGIGTNAPGAKFDVNGAATLGYLYLRAETASNEGGQMTLIGAPGYQNVNMDLYNQMIRFHSSYNGSVFDLSMDTGNLRITGTLSQASDRRLKENIRPLTNGLDKISMLQGVTYKWNKTKLDRTPQMGLIAQDVEKVFPEVVKTDEKGWKSVAYQNLVAPIIEAIKELKVMVVSLFTKTEENHRAIASVQNETTIQAEKIRKLEAENEKLKADMAEIKKMLNKKK